MDLKTSTQMNVHGADGLHAGVDPETGRLLLFWGESKIYADVTSAVRECLASVGPVLCSYSKGERDLQLLQRHADLDDAKLEDALKKVLDPDSDAYNSLEFRGLCLVGFDCDAYPTGPSTTDLAAVVTQIGASLQAWKRHVAARVGEEKLDAFAMHFLFVPFPSADGFRTLLREQLGLRKEARAGSLAGPTTGSAPRGPGAPMPTTDSPAEKGMPAAEPNEPDESSR